MTIEELEQQLPNGFHDSFLIAFRVDFATGSAFIELDLDFDDPGPNMFRRKTLRLDGLSMFVVEPRDLSSSPSTGGRMWLDGCTSSEQIFPKLQSYKGSSTRGTFFYSFFLREWNSFIHIAATNAELL
jgi:hypothetical protein